MILMERSEPALVPQWLRNNGGGTGSGVSRYHIASSDDASLALQKQNRTSRSSNNTDAPYSSFVDRKTGTCSRRSLSNSDSNKHDKHSHARTYSNSYRNQRRDRERLDVDTWDTEFTDSVTNLMVEKFQNGSLRRCQSMNLRRPSELYNRNKNYNVNADGNVDGVVSVANDTSKMPFERDFPVLGSDVRPPTPDFARVLSPRLRSGALAPQNGHQAVQTQRVEELPFVGPKRLIPMTPSLPKTMVLNPSDMLKPKAAMKSNETLPGLGNGSQQISPQLCSHQARGSARSDGPKSFSSGKLLLLKHARETDLSSQVVNVQNTIANGQSTCSKTPQNVKPAEKKWSPAHVQSRNDFFNMVRKKSNMSNTCVTAFGTSDSCRNNKSSDEVKEMDNGRFPPTQSSYCTKNDLSDVGVMYSNAEEEAFLRSLGWEDSAEDEDGLTEEEINSFVQKLKIMTQSDHLKWKSASKSWQSLQLKISAQSDSHTTCSGELSS